MHLDFAVAACDPATPIRSDAIIQRMSFTAVIVGASLAMLCLAAPAAAQDWRTEANARIEKIRKSDFNIRILKPDGTPLGDAPVVVHQTRAAFQFGTAIGGHPWNPANESERQYSQFIIDHFNTITPEQQLKWDFVEATQGTRDYSVADHYSKWASENGLAMRGHALLWQKAHRIPQWNKQLTPEALRASLDSYIEQTVTHFRGKVFCWDVSNELLDANYYSKLFGPDFDAWCFKRTRELDPNAQLFVNEYDVLRSAEKRARYIALIEDLRKRGGGPDAIGIQEHHSHYFDPEDHPALDHQPSSAPAATRPAPARLYKPQEMVDALNDLSTLKLPIVLTEITSDTPDVHHRAETLDMVFRIGYSHPNVQGVILWGFWANRHFRGPQAALVNRDFTLNPAGQRIFDMLLKEWRTNLDAATDGAGQIQFRGFHGRYEIRCGDLVGMIDLDAAHTHGDVPLRLSPATAPTTAASLPTSDDSTTSSATRPAK